MSRPFSHCYSYSFIHYYTLPCVLRRIPPPPLPPSPHDRCLLILILFGLRWRGRSVRKPPRSEGLEVSACVFLPRWPRERAFVSCRCFGRGLRSHA